MISGRRSFMWQGSLTALTNEDGPYVAGRLKLDPWHSHSRAELRSRPFLFVCRYSLFFRPDPGRFDGRESFVRRATPRKRVDGHLPPVTNIEAIG